MHDGPVDLARLTRAEDLAEVGRDLARLGDEQHARRVAVEPMHEARPLAIHIRHRLEHAIDMVLGAGTALHGQAPWLVEHHEPLVLEEEHVLQRAGIGLVGHPLHGGRRRRRLRLDRRNAHALPGLQAGRCLDALAVDTHLPGPHDLVEMAEREHRQPPLEPAVEPHLALVLGHHEHLDAGGHGLDGCGRNLRLLARRAGGRYSRTSR